MKNLNKVDTLVDADHSFDYQPFLTKKLDDYSADFDQSIINEITLWKVSRYPIIDEALLAEINTINKSDTRVDLPKVRDILLRLLECHGVQLPMASTYLRFKNPQLFQIIDQRVYRAIYGKELKLPGSYNRKNRMVLVDIYFEYLHKLKERCKMLSIPFEQADRILYTADKRINKEKLNNY